MTAGQEDGPHCGLAVAAAGPWAGIEHHSPWLGCHLNQPLKPGPTIPPTKPWNPPLYHCQRVAGHQGEVVLRPPQPAAHSPHPPHPICSVWLDTTGREVVVRRPVDYDASGWPCIADDKMRVEKDQVGGWGAANLNVAGDWVGLGGDGWVGGV